MKRIILTGERNRGKTSFCRHLAGEASNRGMNVAGILSLKEMENGRETSLWASDCREEAKRKLARFIPEAERIIPSEKSSMTPSWSFYPETFLWGNALLRQAAPSDLFILDEAGPLEFTPGTSSPGKDNAWTAGMERMDAEIDGIALVVVRPVLTDRALFRWSDAEVMEAPDCRDPGLETTDMIEKILGRND